LEGAGEAAVVTGTGGVWKLKGSAKYIINYNAWGLFKVFLKKQKTKLS
jgi:hypothetical protein